MKKQLQYWILTADLLWAVVAMMAAYVLRFGFEWNGPVNGSFLDFLPLLLAALGLWGFIFFRMRLDGFCNGWYPPAVFSQLFLAVGLLMAGVLTVGYLARVYESRLTVTYFGITLLIGFVAIRYSAHGLLGSRYSMGAVRRVLIVGSGPLAREMASKIERHPELLCEVVGFLYSAASSFDSRMRANPGEARTIQTLEVADFLQERKVDEVIVALSKPGSHEVMNLVQRCRQAGIVVSVIPQPYELYLSKPQLLDIGGLPILQLGEVNAKFADAAWKRGLDLVLGSILSVLSLPVTLIGVVSLMHKRGGPLRRELRCGRAGTLFRMWRLNSDRRGKEISRWEYLLQQLSVTELPQLWNVLTGEMSLVGPRPEPPERVRHYSDWQKQRLNVKPGMTGLAQVHGLREQHESDDKARFDLQYMLQPSLFFDVSLLMQTIWTLMARVLSFSKLTPNKPAKTSNRLLREFD